MEISKKNETTDSGRILVADDDSVFLKIIERRLSGWGYAVQSVRDGEKAWKCLQDPQSPGLVLLDWMMPEMDGLEVCRRLRAVETGIPRYVIMLTSRDGSDDMVRGLDAGADDYLIKPVNDGELRARIDVGRRIRALHASLAGKEKMRGALELAEKICHEMNQPMQVVSGTCELMLMDMAESDPLFQKLKVVKSHVDIMGDITRKLLGVASF